MFLEGLVKGSKGEPRGSTSALAKRSLMASKGKGAVTCVDQEKELALLPVIGLDIDHGLQLLPSIFH